MDGAGVYNMVSLAIILYTSVMITPTWIKRKELPSSIASKMDIED